MKLLMITGTGYDDLEVYYAYYRLMEEGYEIDIAASQKGLVTGVHSQIEAKFSYGEITKEQYNGLILPGGMAPEMIRLDRDAVDAVKYFAENKLPIAAICHGLQLLITAQALNGKKCTTYPTIKDDVKNAGADYQDEPCVVDGNLVTSRCPDDLPYFVKSFIELLNA